MENTWTSVNEELPKKRGEFWVTYLCCGAYRMVDSCWYENGHFYRPGCPRIEISNVIAWMPLERPKMYLGK